MSVKAGFKTASKELKCSDCKSVIKFGERYFEAKPIFQKRITTCVSCIRKSGIFTEADINTDGSTTVKGSLNPIKQIQSKANDFDTWLRRKHPEEYEYANKWRIDNREKAKNPGYIKRIIQLTDEMLKEG